LHFALAGILPGDEEIFTIAVEPLRRDVDLAFEAASAGIAALALRAAGAACARAGRELAGIGSTAAARLAGLALALALPLALTLTLPLPLALPLTLALALALPLALPLALALSALPALPGAADALAARIELVERPAEGALVAQLALGLLEGLGGG